VEKLKQKRWLRVTLYVIALVGIGVGFLILFPYLSHRFSISIEGLASTAYLVVFGITLLSNAAVLVPVTYPHIAVMILAAAYWDPFMIALVASVAGALGEITAYYAGFLGKRIARLDNVPGYQRLVRWMQKNGMWGIFVISAQPILPVDVAGLLAGASRMPLWKFLVACWAGKLVKYILACYIGEAILGIFPLPAL
jgi:uncharacterized membrane protein YdjX (TVP38/TMEM64 family)